MPRSTYWGGGTVIAAGVWWFFLEFVKELLFGALGTWVTSRMSDDGAQLLFDYVVPYGPPILLLSLGIMALSGVGQNIHITASPPFFRKVKRKDAPATQSIQAENLTRYEDPIHEAIEYVARRIGDNDASDFFDFTRKALRQAAISGEIKMRGRKELEGKEGYYDGVYTRIEPSYWENHVLNKLSAGRSWESHAHTQAIVLERELHRNRYWSVRVNMDEIRKRWP